MPGNSDTKPAASCASRVRRLLIALSLALFCLPAIAQAPPNGEPAAPAPAPAPTDPLGRSTPAGTIDGFIGAIASQNYERAAQYLDLSWLARGRRAAVGPDWAQDLQRALDRTGDILPASRLSHEPAGDLTDGLAPDLERVGRVGADEEATDVLLQRVESEGAQIWLITRETLIPALAIAAGDTEAVAEAWLPEALTDTELAGAPASHWLTLVGLTLSALLFVWLLVRAVLLVLRRLRWKDSKVYRFLTASIRPLVLLLAIIVASSIAPTLGISIVARRVYGWLGEIVGWIALGWLLWRLVQAVSDQLLEGFGRRSRAAATSIVRFAGRIAKLAVVALTIMAILNALGFDVSTGLAALGLGGIALALGAQKTVENLIASVSIISDRPFRVGDFCRAGAALGIVEDIGMRSTRIRTLDRTVLTIPNSTLVSSEIENFAERDRFWFKPVLHLSTATPPEKIRAVLDGLRAVLEGDERLLNRTARVRLLLPANDRLPIEIFGYVLAVDFDAYLAVQEELMLKLLDTVAAHDLVLAPPPLDLRRVEA